MESKDLEISFVGIDDWNRPVFKLKDKKVYFGDTNKLWTFNELGENNKNLIEYYSKNPQCIEFFGGSFNCEPHGGTSDKWNFIINN